MNKNRKFTDNRTWRKSSRSGDNAGACLYATTGDGKVGVRDSKQGDHGPQLWLPEPEWSSLIIQLSHR